MNIYKIYFLGGGGRRGLVTKLTQKMQATLERLAPLHEMGDFLVGSQRLLQCFRRALSSFDGSGKLYRKNFCDNFLGFSI